MSFDQSLDRYAELIVRVGLNLQPGQRLFITGPTTLGGVPLSAAPLVRRVTTHAYQAGARLVDVVWGDEDVILTRFRQAPRDSFADFPMWRAHAYKDSVSEGAAVLMITGGDPDLLAGEDPELVALAQRTAVTHLKEALQAISSNAINWCVAAAVSPAWGAKVFADQPPAEQEARFWDTLFALCRLDQPDPVAAWNAHIQALQSRSAYLNAKAYDALRLTAPGTSLTMGLPAGHIWGGARSKNAAGVPFTANLPTEEVFTLPDRARVDGVVRAALPLAYGGTIIDDFSVTFRDGRAVDVQAGKGETVLRRLIETDEGAARLGEIALVPQSSPIAQSGRLFYNILIDENASTHIALGRAYKFNLDGGTGMDDETFQQGGGNLSLIHVDFMIGSAQMDIDGLTANGRAEPVMRQGEWAFEV